MQLVHVLAGSYGKPGMYFGAILRTLPHGLRKCRGVEKEWRSAFTPNSGSFSVICPFWKPASQSLIGFITCHHEPTVLQAHPHLRHPALVYATGMPSSQLTFAVTSSFCGMP